ncbi:MAG: LysM peptidoglycan-binding domain-containing protein, partial [Anaerolineae bacterium]|nr:LysM peptidoglycan-binding domain-containing protein [Anaerolineae bacterium]
TATSTPTPASSPTQAPTTELVVHTVKRGEYLALIARQYDVSVQAIVDANNIQDPNHIVVGQKLVIPVSGQPPAATATKGPANTAPAAASATRPPATATPRPATATPRPATATPRPATATPKPAPAGSQFTGVVVWDPQVAPNCSGPAISRQSMVQDTAGTPINGVRIAVDCYGNVWISHPTGNPGEYDAGHYDFAFGQLNPQPWTCTAYVYDVNGERVTSSQVVTIVFDTNDCQPHGSGHQVAILNWVKNW